MRKSNAAVSSIYDRGLVEAGEDGIHPDPDPDFDIESDPDDDDGSTSNPQEALGDSPELQQRIRSVVERIQQLKLDRKQINDEITSEYTDLEAHGINRQALKEALKRLDMSHQKRAERDMSYALVLKALGIAYQADLFVD